MDDKDKDLLAGFHHTISEQLNSRLSESPQFFGLLVVVATGYGYTLAHPEPHLKTVANALAMGATLWAGWYLAALGYAFRFLQTSQHLIERKLDWSRFAPTPGEPPECYSNPLDWFWLLPGIYHAHVLALMFLGVLICLIGLPGYWSWIGSAVAVCWVAGWNLRYLVKFKHRKTDTPFPLSDRQTRVMKRTVEEALKYSDGAHESVWNQLMGTHFPATPRSSLVLAYVAVALEHQNAISTLVRAGLKGSGLAVMRLQLETALRGMWVNLIASDIQVDCISQHGDEPFPKFRVLVKQLDDAYGAEGWLESFANQWATLNGYTHSGLEQLGRRFQADGNLAPNYPEEVICDLLTLSGTVTIGTIVPLLRGFGFPEKAEALEKWLADNTVTASENANAVGETARN